MFDSIWFIAAAVPYLSVPQGFTNSYFGINDLREAAFHFAGFEGGDECNVGCDFHSVGESREISGNVG